MQFLEFLSYLQDHPAWVSAGFAVLLLAISLRQYIRTVRLQHYSELDVFYTDILKMAVDRPYLRDQHSIDEFMAVLRNDHAQSPWLANSTDPRHARARQYDAYAFIVMNFLETIHDRCDENRSWRGRVDPTLASTWRGIIASEYAIHQKWFIWQLQSEDKCAVSKFCKGFCHFMLFERWNDSRWCYFSDRRLAVLKDDIAGCITAKRREYEW